MDRGSPAPANAKSVTSRHYSCPDYSLWCSFFASYFWNSLWTPVMPNSQYPSIQYSTCHWILEHFALKSFLTIHFAPIFFSVNPPQSWYMPNPLVAGENTSYWMVVHLICRSVKISLLTSTNCINKKRNYAEAWMKMFKLTTGTTLGTLLTVTRIVKR